MAHPVARLSTRFAYGARQLPRVAWYVGHALVMRRLSETVREAAGQSARPRSHTDAPVPDRKRLYADMATLLRQDLANVEAGIYPLPADNDGSWPTLLNRSRLFFEDLPDVHRRRESGEHRQILSEATRGKRPGYYLQNFHFQSGGWMTPDSAQRYDTQVEVLFNGTANATRRQALVPLHEIFAGRDQRRLQAARCRLRHRTLSRLLQAGLAAAAGDRIGYVRGLHRRGEATPEVLVLDQAAGREWGSHSVSGCKPGCGDQHFHVP